MLNSVEDKLVEIPLLLQARQRKTGGGGGGKSEPPTHTNMKTGPEEK